MRNLLRLIIVLAMSFTSSYISAQDTIKYPDTTNSRKININNLYFEYKGQGIRYSLNYERVLLHKKPPLAFRSGLSYFFQPSFMYAPVRVPDMHFLVIPFSLCALIGKLPNYMDMGAGVTMVNIFQTGQTTISNLLGNFIIGYRRQTAKGLMFRVTYSPFIYLYSNDKTLDRSEYAFGIPGKPIWGGLSIGYSFPNSKKSK